MQTKSNDWMFIDLDLWKFKEETPAVTEKADEPTQPVVPETKVEEPTKEETTPEEPAIVPEVETPAPAEEEAPETTIPEWEETPDSEEWDVDAETLLKQALWLDDQSEEILDTMPDSPEKIELQKIIDQKQSIIEKLIKDKDEVLFDRETKDLELNEMKRLYGNFEWDDSLKQLILYSNKAKSDETFKEKKLNVLKDMLKQEWFDIDELSNLKLEQEKQALWWGESSKMTVNYKWPADKTDGFISL